MIFKPKKWYQISLKQSLEDLRERLMYQERIISDLRKEACRMAAWRCNPDFVPEDPSPVIAKIRPYPGFAILRYFGGTWQRFDEFKGWEDYSDKNIISWRDII